MVAIRLARTGAKKKPSYRVVVTDKRQARDSKTLEILGHYNPRPTPIELNLQRERVDYWLGVGAQPSDTVRRLIKFFDANGPTLQSAKIENLRREAEAKPVVKMELKPAEPAATVAPSAEAAEASSTAGEATPAAATEESKPKGEATEESEPAGEATPAAATEEPKPEASE